MDQDVVNLAFLVFRCAIGAVMLAHGYNHIWGGGKIEGTAGWFESLGMKPGVLHAWLASLAELAAGVSLILGLLTPLGGAAVTATMLVALITNHRGNGFFIFRPGEGWEYVMTLVCAGFLLSVLGAGEWSLDSALDIFQTDTSPFPGAAGFWISLVAGFGAGLALLAIFWRPEPASSESDEEAG